jgi:hypothetical protein
MSRGDYAEDGDEVQLLGGKFGESGFGARYAGPGND